MKIDKMLLHDLRNRTHDVVTCARHPSFCTPTEMREAAEDLAKLVETLTPALTPLEEAAELVRKFMYGGE